MTNLISMEENDLTLATTPVWNRFSLLELVSKFIIMGADIEPIQNRAMTAQLALCCLLIKNMSLIQVRL